MNRIFLLALVLVLVSTSLSRAYAPQRMSILRDAGVEDAYFRGTASDSLNFGGSTTAQIGRTTASGIFRYWERCTFPGIPPEAIVDSLLVLHWITAVNGAADSIMRYICLRPVVEGDGVGSVADTTQGITWLHYGTSTVTRDTTWTGLGASGTVTPPWNLGALVENSGDRTSSAVARTFRPATTGIDTLRVPPELAETWISGRLENNGLITKQLDETTNTRNFVWRTAESGTTAERPTWILYWRDPRGVQRVGSGS